MSQLGPPVSTECNWNAGTTEDDALSVEQSVYLGAAVLKEPMMNEKSSTRTEDELSADSTPEPRKKCLGTVCAILGGLMPAGGMLSTMFNMASTSIGAGILGLPAAFNSVGIAMAVLYLTLITAETIYSMRLLVLTSAKTGLRTYEEMASRLLHPRLSIAVACIRFLHTFGGCVAYVVTIGNLITPILEDCLAPDHYLLSTAGTWLLQAGLWFVFFLPLSLPREVSSLRYVSAFGFFMIVFFCFCIVAHSISHGLRANRRPMTTVVNTGNEAVQGLGVFIFSYMCQVNTVEIASEMTNRNVRCFTLCAIVSMSVCGVLYLLVGLFGYLDFGSAVDGSVLLMFSPMSEPVFMVSYIGVFIKMCASYGLLGNTCRCAIYQAFGTNYLTVPLWKHLIVAISVAATSLLGGLFIPNVNMVFGFVGGFCGGFIAFILPALFIMYSGKWNLKSVGIVNYISTHLTLFAGVVAIVFGTASTIYSAVAG